METQVALHRKEHMVSEAVVKQRQEEYERKKRAKELKRLHKWHLERRREREWSQRTARASARASIALNMAAMQPVPPPRPGEPRPQTMPLVRAGMRVLRPEEVAENTMIRLRELRDGGGRAR